MYANLMDINILMNGVFDKPLLTLLLTVCGIRKTSTLNVTQISSKLLEIGHMTIKKLWNEETHKISVNQLGKSLNCGYVCPLKIVGTVKVCKKCTDT